MLERWFSLRRNSAGRCKASNQPPSLCLRITDGCGSRRTFLRRQGRSVPCYWGKLPNRSRRGQVNGKSRSIRKLVLFPVVALPFGIDLGVNLSAANQFLQIAHYGSPRHPVVLAESGY